MWRTARFASDELRKAAQEFNRRTPLQELRLLSTDPRPWAIYGLIRKQVRLTDGASATLVRWCRELHSLIQVSEHRSVARSQSAALMDALLEHHAASHMALHEYWRFCADVQDLESAFRVFNAATERNLITELPHYVALLRVVSRFPGDDDACDAALTVTSQCLKMGQWCAELDREFTAIIKTRLPNAECPELQELARDPKMLALRTRKGDIPTNDRVLSSALWTTPYPVDSMAESSSSRWLRMPSAALRYSVLSPTWHSRLVEASNSGKMDDAVKAVSLAREDLKSEVSRAVAAAREQDANHSHSFLDADRRAFLVKNESVLGKATPDVYHHLVTAMRHAPASVMRVLDSMKKVDVEPLDITLAVAAGAVASDSRHFDNILTWFSERREKRDAHNRDCIGVDGVEAQVDAWWQYDALAELQHRNALSSEDFLSLVGATVPTSTFHGACITTKFGPSSPISSTPEDAVVLDDAVASAVAGTLARTATKSIDNAEEAVTFVAKECPKLDIAIVGRIANFGRFVPPRPYLHDPRALREHVLSLAAAVQPCPLPFAGAPDAIDGGDDVRHRVTVCLVDASFLETSPRSLMTFRDCRAVALLPVGTLLDLNTSVEQAESGAEVTLARQVLSSIADVLSVDPTSNRRIVADILYFSELLPFLSLASSKALRDLHAYGDRSLLAAAVGLATLVPEVDVAVCSDDPALIQRTEEVALELGVKVATVRTKRVTEADAALVDGEAILQSLPQEFEPMLRDSTAASTASTASAQSDQERDVAADPPQQQPTSVTPSTTAPSASTWLDLLEEDATAATTHKPTAPVAPHAEVDEAPDDTNIFWSFVAPPKTNDGASPVAMEAEFSGQDQGSLPATIVDDAPQPQQPAQQRQSKKKAPADAAGLDAEDFLERPHTTRAHRQSLFASVKNKRGHLAARDGVRRIRVNVNDPRNLDLLKRYEASLRKEKLKEKS